MPYLVIESYGHDSHTDQKAYVTDDPPELVNHPEFTRSVIFLDDHVAAHEQAIRRTIVCEDEHAGRLNQSLKNWSVWLDEINFNPASSDDHDALA